MKTVVYDETDLQSALASFLDCLREIDDTVTTLNAADADGTIVDSADVAHLTDVEP